MINFDIKNQADIIFGRNAEDQIADLIKENGGTRVLIHHVSEPFVQPLIDKLTGLMRDAGLYVVDLGGVVPNPRIEKVNEGVALCKKEKIDFVLAVGGGSVIDSSKLIALAADYDGDAWDYCIGKAQVNHRPLPLGVVSTFAGTGSENTAGLVINKESEHAKRGLEHDWIKPRFSVLDPELTMTIPPFQTACGIADITSHLTEDYFTPDTDSLLARNLLTAGLRTAIECAKAVMADPKDYEARSNLMFLSPMAINGFLKPGRSGDWACHAMEHKMSGDWDIPHGAGLAVVTPVWMRYIYRDYLDQFVNYAVDVWNVENDPDDPEKVALAGIAEVENYFYNVLKLPRKLSDLGVKNISEEELATVVKKNFQYGNDTIGRMAPLYYEDVYKIYKECM